MTHSRRRIQGRKGEHGGKERTEVNGQSSLPRISASALTPENGEGVNPSSRPERGKRAWVPEKESKLGECTDNPPTRYNDLEKGTHTKE